MSESEMSNRQTVTFGWVRVAKSTFTHAKQTSLCDDSDLQRVRAFPQNDAKSVT